MPRPAPAITRRKMQEKVILRQRLHDLHPVGLSLGTSWASKLDIKKSDIKYRQAHQKMRLLFFEN
ncbi:hypothetical protein HMPREF1210_02471 [Paenisporosarcina sp. HGH0030]|nr:hypothetical protein HMPREF1210_02471 [Paenisporosarcina sp. HGH0030]